MPGDGAGGGGDRGGDRVGEAGRAFRSSPGGYFHGMVAKAQAGELNLMRTVWGLRQKRDRRAGEGSKTIHRLHRGHRLQSQ